MEESNKKVKVFRLDWMHKLDTLAKPACVDQHIDLNPLENSRQKFRFLDFRWKFNAYLIVLVVKEANF